MNEAILNHIEPLFFGAESFRRAMNWLKNLPKMEAISTPLIISWRSKFAPIVVRKRGSICWATSMKEDLSKLVYSHLWSDFHTPLTNRQTESGTSVESLYFWLETLSFSLNTYSKNSPWKGRKGHLFERIIGWEETFDSHGPMVNPPRPGTSYRLLANEGPMKRIYPSLVIFKEGVFRNEHHHVGCLSKSNYPLVN